MSHPQASGLMGLCFLQMWRCCRNHLASTTYRKVRRLPKSWQKLQHCPAYFRRDWELARWKPEFGGGTTAGIPVRSHRQFEGEACSGKGFYMIYAFFFIKYSQVWWRRKEGRTNSANRVTRSRVLGCGISCWAFVAIQFVVHSPVTANSYGFLILFEQRAT